MEKLAKLRRWLMAKVADWLAADDGDLQRDREAVLEPEGEYAAAEATLRQLLCSDSQNPDAREDLGLLYLKKGLPAKAAEELRLLTEVDQTRASAYLYLGEALSQINEVDQAMAAFKRLLELQPSSPEGHYKLGVLYDRSLQPELAEQVYRKARELRESEQMQLVDQ